MEELALGTLSFSGGVVGGAAQPLRFRAGAGALPTLVDAGVPGALAAAWP